MEVQGTPAQAEAVNFRQALAARNTFSKALQIVENRWSAPNEAAPRLCSNATLTVDYTSLRLRRIQMAAAIMMMPAIAPAQNWG